MSQSQISVLVKCNEHCNIDSFPLRFGFTLNEDNDCILLLEDKPKTDRRFEDRLIYQATMIHPITNERYSGTFVVRESAKGKVLVTAWRNDIETEFYLSEVMKMLRKSGVLSTQQLLDFHPNYEKKNLNSHADLVLALSANKSALQIQNIQEQAQLAVNRTEALLRELTLENTHLKLQNTALKQQNEITELLEEVRSKNMSGFWIGMSVTLAAVIFAVGFFVLGSNIKSPDSNISSDQNAVQVTTTSESLWPPAYAVSTKNAINHVDSAKTVCGTVTQVTDFAKGTYLNLNKSFPNTLFTAVIWNSDKERVLDEQHSFHGLLDSKVCVSGKISSFNNRAQIVVKSKSQLVWY
ncbi:sulfatase [Vibrio kyushuensis]|uniref:sulfatase n=1 Tax=Vibrio kyushuensis TaxID=2910249 RepID=UPI003D0BFDED